MSKPYSDPDFEIVEVAKYIGKPIEEWPVEFLEIMLVVCIDKEIMAHVLRHMILGDDPECLEGTTQAIREMLTTTLADKPTIYSVVTKKKRMH
jgi:hypothetical protein